MCAFSNVHIVYVSDLKREEDKPISSFLWLHNICRMGVNHAVGVQAARIHTRTRGAEELISCKAELGAEPALGLEDAE